MKHIQLILAALLLTLCSCQQKASLPTSPVVKGNEKGEAMRIRYGTSFGMCYGYCQKTLQVDSLAFLYTQFSPRDTVKFPTKTESGSLSLSEWNCLMNSFAMADFMKLDTIIGCPDCADGGAEWIEITQNGITRKVTFENGATIASIQKLIDKLRRLHDNLQGESGNYIYQSWDWVKSVGGFAGITQTPATAGYTLRVVFRSNGTVQSYRNDSLELEGTYTIGRKQLGGVEETVVTYPKGAPYGFQQEQIMRLAGDTLQLQDYCADCYDHVLVRSRSLCGE